MAAFIVPFLPVPQRALDGPLRRLFACDAEPHLGPRAAGFSLPSPADARGLRLESRQGQTDRQAGLARTG
ncbi:hypothetical protein HMPREF0972_00695 [Actinomyces sp. oral taxon 848 str. F0332]|uniref:Uncharacterized protein n=1 Tax=Peptidiphaga gingivicola TaxID=2741497 RepID=A0A179B281_9ACTO|nr:hypothetical protein HMPREF0972_00695 [Actinomyces sp. oral taxon 848 str. F0332]OAP85828.1 hypothetical protein A4H34_01135 [Peptidiphaga gingivicola]